MGFGHPQLKFAVSFQAVSQWIADQILNGTGLVGVVHIIAGGPYYDFNNTVNSALYTTLTPADIIARCNTSLSTLNPILSIQSTVSQVYNLSMGLSMGAYESGTSISENSVIYNGNDNVAATTNFISTNQHPIMYNIYKQILYSYKIMALFQEHL